jgi:hypothetical protein
VASRDLDEVARRLNTPTPPDVPTMSPNLSPTEPHQVTSDGRVGTGRIRDRIGRNERAWHGSPRTSVKALIT